MSILEDHVQVLSLAYSDSMVRRRRLACLDLTCTNAGCSMVLLAGDTQRNWPSPLRGRSSCLHRAFSACRLPQLLLRRWRRVTQCGWATMERRGLMKGRRRVSGRGPRNADSDCLDTLSCLSTESERATQNCARCIPLFSVSLVYSASLLLHDRLPPSSHFKRCVSLSLSWPFRCCRCKMLHTPLLDLSLAEMNGRWPRWSSRVLRASSLAEC